MADNIFMLRKKEYLTSSPSQTRALGKKLAQEILKKLFILCLQKVKAKPLRQKFWCEGKAFVMGLEGDLGGGKTTFLQGFARGLGIKEKVTSPTFVIMKRFQLNNLTIKQFNNFYHIDCYRIKKTKELLELGFKEIITNPKNIIAVEWADKIKEILPNGTLWIEFTFKNKTQRKVLVKY